MPEESEPLVQLAGSERAPLPGVAPAGRLDTSERAELTLVLRRRAEIPADIVEGLRKLGHQTTRLVSPLGGGQAIWIDWDKGTLTGGSDPRKDGCALGY